MREIIRIGCFSCSDGFIANERWAQDARHWVDVAAVDVLVTSELPFGAWLATTKVYNSQSARKLVQLHARELQLLASLGAPTVITSIARMGIGRLQNQAALIEGSTTRLLHTKRHLPQEDGWFEQSWFEPGTLPPQSVDVNGLRVATLLCTEAMFPDDARTLGQTGVDLIAIPRATAGNVMWDHAVAMAAISSGAFVVSVNRSGGAFAGGSCAFSPHGELVEPLDREGAFSLFEIDLAVARAARWQYPRYVFADRGCAAELVTA